MSVTVVRFTERSSGRVTGTLVDRYGHLVPGSSLSVATLTLFDLDTYDPSVSPAEGIINDRDSQDVLGVGSPLEENGVTIYDELQSETDPDQTTHTYSFEWLLDPADNVIVTQRRQVERHRALFVFTWANGEIRVEFEIEVMNTKATA